MVEVKLYDYYELRDKIRDIASKYCFDAYVYTYCNFLTLTVEKKVGKLTFEYCDRIYYPKCLKKDPDNCGIRIILRGNECSWRKTEKDLKEEFFKEIEDWIVDKKEKIDKLLTEC